MECSLGMGGVPLRVGGVPITNGGLPIKQWWRGRVECPVQVGGIPSASRWNSQHELVEFPALSRIPSKWVGYPE